MATTHPITMSQMVDLALGTPEVGAVNFNVLHTLLHAMLSRLNFREVLAEMDDDDRRALEGQIKETGATLTELHGQGGKETTTPSSGLGSAYSDGVGVVPMQSSPYHALQDRLNALERQICNLNSLPDNKDLFDQLLGGHLPDKRAISELWQNVQAKRRIDANEEGVNRLASLLDDMMKEIGRLKEDNTRLKDQVSEMAKMQAVFDRLDAMENQLKQLSQLCKSLTERLDQYPSPDAVRNMVTWEALEKAMRGIREDMELLRKPTERIVINMATDPMSRVPSPSVSSSGPSEAFAEMLEDLGKLNSRHDKLESRVEDLEKTMPTKADKKDVENLKIPDDVLKSISDMKAQLDQLLATRNRDNEAMLRIREALNNMQKQLDNYNSILDKMRQDGEDTLTRISELFNITTDHEGRKADITYVDTKVEPKADKRLLEMKVNFNLFDETTGNLQKLIEDVLNKLLSAEEDLRRLFNELSGGIDGKMDRMELDALKEWLEKRLRALAAKIKMAGARDLSEDEAAGLRRQLLHFHCISCDRPLDMMPQLPQPSLPERQGLPPAKAMRAYTTFELDTIRQHQRNMGQDILDVYQTPRPCGGSHTVTFPHKRVTRMSTMNGTFVDEEVPIPQNKYCRQTNRWLHRVLPSNRLTEELDLQGVDGHIYKGRLDFRGVTYSGSAGQQQIALNQPQSQDVPEKLPPVTSAGQQQQAGLQSTGGVTGGVNQAKTTRPRSARVMTPRATSSASGVGQGVSRSRPLSARVTSEPGAVTPPPNRPAQQMGDAGARSLSAGPTTIPSLEVPHGASEGGAEELVILAPEESARLAPSAPTEQEEDLGEGGGIHTSDSLSSITG